MIVEQSSLQLLSGQAVFCRDWVGLISGSIPVNYIPRTKVSTYGGLLRSIQFRGEAERAQVSFYLASVAE